MKKINYAAMFTLRSDGRYQGYWRELINGEPKGPRHTICDRDPKRLYEKIQAKQTAVTLMFEDIAAAWHDKHWERIREGTRVCYNPAYYRALEEFARREAASIEPWEISRHLQRLADQDYSAKTIKTQRTVYNLIYQNAVIDRELGQTVRVNPAAPVPLPQKMKKPNKREAPETDAVKIIKSRANDAYFGIYPLFLICTGFRKGEALGLRWGDIDFKENTISCNRQANYEGGTVTITPQKTDNAARTVPLLPILREALLSSIPEKDRKDNEYVFPGENPKKPMPESTYRRKWIHYCKEVGFVRDVPEIRVSKQGKRYVVHHYKPTLTAHCMRHGYATVLFEAGVDVMTAKKLLGHAQIETTMAVYTHLRELQEKKSLATLGAHIEHAL